MIGRPSAPGSRRAEAASWQRTVMLGSAAAISARRKARVVGIFPSSLTSRTVQARTYSPGCRNKLGRHRIIEAPANVEAPEPLQGVASVFGLTSQCDECRPGAPVAACGELHTGLLDVPAVRVP